MNHATEVMIRFSTYDGFTKAEENEESLVRSKNLIQERKAVFQSLGDQIWVFYRFKTETDKDDFLRALAPEAQAWVAHDFSKPWGSA